MLRNKERVAGQGRGEEAGLGPGPLAAIVRNTGKGLKNGQGMVRVQVTGTHRRQTSDGKVGRDLGRFWLGRVREQDSHRLKACSTEE